jgi:hypothetical protein
MKKLWIGIVTVLAITSCNDGTENTESSPNLTNVQNVNGNMPDTSSSISLDNKQTDDSLTIKDSANR